MRNFIDPAIHRKSDLIDSSLVVFEKKIPLPAIVEVSASGTCNRVCSFCPRSAPDYLDIKEYIKNELLEKLVSQLAELGFKGIFLFSGFNEPLVDKNIYHLVSIARKYLTDCRIEMVTNGDILNEKRLSKLYESGLDTLLISVYDSKEQEEKLIELCLSVGLLPDQYVIRPRYLPPEDDFGITLSNRGGRMSNAGFPIEDLKEPLSEPCFYPHYEFFMDYQGDVLLCPHDWGKKSIVGNLNHSNFIDIWTAQTMNDARRSLVDGNRCFSPCNVCDVRGTLMGEKHVDAWKMHE